MSGGAMVAIVLLVIALIAVVVYFMGGFAGSGDEADLEIDVDLDSIPGSTSALPEADRIGRPGTAWQVRYLT